MNNFTPKTLLFQPINHEGGPGIGPGGVPFPAVRPERGEPGPGPLSNAHIRPQGSASYWVGGSKVKFSKPKIKTLGKHSCGIRGEIKKFTRASRLRLMYKLAEVRQDGLPQFMTLTYPDRYPEVDQAKKDFSRLVKRLKRRFPAMSLFWKLEPQDRGAPHFHCLVWGLPGWAVLEPVATAWYEIAGGGDINHLLFHLGALPRSKPCISQVRSWRGVMSYASKYLGKELTAGTWASPGRFWGVLYRDQIPWAEMIRETVTYQGACNLIRALRRYTGIKTRDYKSLSGFVNNPAFWHEKHNQLAYGYTP